MLARVVARASALLVPSNLTTARPALGLGSRVVSRPKPLPALVVVRDARGDAQYRYVSGGAPSPSAALLPPCSGQLQGLSSQLGIGVSQIQYLKIR